MCSDQPRQKIQISKKKHLPTVWYKTMYLLSPWPLPGFIKVSRSQRSGFLHPYGPRDLKLILEAGMTQGFLIHEPAFWKVERRQIVELSRHSQWWLIKVCCLCYIPSKFPHCAIIFRQPQSSRLKTFINLTRRESKAAVSLLLFVASSESSGRRHRQKYAYRLLWCLRWGMLIVRVPILFIVKIR